MPGPMEILMVLMPGPIELLIVVALSVGSFTVIGILLAAAIKILRKK